MIGKYLCHFQAAKLLRARGSASVGLFQRLSTQDKMDKISEPESGCDLVSLGNRLKDSMTHFFSKRSIDMTLCRKDVVCRDQIHHETVTGLQHLWTKAMLRRAALKLRYAFVTLHVADVKILEEENAVEILCRAAGMGFIRAAITMGLRFRRIDLLVAKGRIGDGRAKFSFNSEGLVTEILITKADITPLLKAVSP